MKYSQMLAIIVGLILSLVITKVVYFGFTPNYAADVFSRKAFNSRMDHDVYKYRVLSKYLLLVVDRWLAADMPERGAEARLSIYMRDASERFYLAFYYLNAFFLVLTSVVVALLVNLSGDLLLTEMEKWLIIFWVPLLIGISEFTVTCYDVSGYFFQLLILYLYLLLNRRRYWLSLWVIAILVMLSTLNRESSALSVSMVAALLLGNYGLKRKALLGIALLGAFFLTTYIGLRWLVTDPSHIRILNLQAGKLLIDINFIGLLFWGLFFLLPMLIARGTENRRVIGVFFLFSLPYILTCLKDGVLWEIRLYMPLFLAALFFSRIDPARLSYWSDRELRALLKTVGFRDSKSPA
jgi:hypothetical protein